MSDKDIDALESLSERARAAPSAAVLKRLAWAAAGGFALGVVTTLLAVAVTWAVVT